MFQRESMDESNERELKQLEVELESKNTVIKSLNKKIKEIEQENDDDLKSNDTEDTCKKCNFKAKTGNNLKINMRKEHKSGCQFCEYSSTTKVMNE
jgi:benzoyl-CoA reductase/2-hydroxyglutaryl-CoA dehydratase subunit BcrC/BadD/HgdB